MTATTNLTAIQTALDADHRVTAIIHDASGYRHDGQVTSTDAADATATFIDDEAGALFYVAATDIVEWEVVA